MKRLSPADTRSTQPSAFLFVLGVGFIVRLDQFLGPYGFFDFCDTIEVHFSYPKTGMDFGSTAGAAPFDAVSAPAPASTAASGAPCGPTKPWP